ncbi:MAG: tetratricopeptide repeat protein, partial [Verrucomicrobiota bacterium]
MKKWTIILQSIGAGACLWMAGMTPAVADPNDPTAEQFYSGNALYNRKLYLLAIAEYQQFLDKYPDHAKAEQARWGIAICQYAAGKYKEAAISLGDVVDRGKHGDRNRLLLYQGQCYLKLKQLPEAEKAYRQVGAGKYQATALAALTDTRFSQRKWAEAMDSARQLAKLSPPESLARRALYQAGYAAREEEAWKEGIGFLEQLRPLIT